MVAIDSHLIFGIGLLGNILSLLVTLAPIATFYKVYKKKSTGSFQSIPYVVTLSSAALWLYYGFLAHKVLLLTINTTTCVLESLYLAIYLTYASKSNRAHTLKTMIFFNVGLLGMVFFGTLAFLRGQSRIEITGWICASFAISVFAAPLSIMRLIIRTKSVEYMPFSLSLFLTLSAVAWFFYGLLLKDYFVALPNVLGFALGIAQVVLYLVYKNARKDREEESISNDATETEITGSKTFDVERAEKHVLGNTTQTMQHLAAPEA